MRGKEIISWCSLHWWPTPIHLESVVENASSGDDELEERLPAKIAHARIKTLVHPCFLVSALDLAARTKTKAPQGGLFYDGFLKNQSFQPSVTSTQPVS